jgi:two-component system, NtrC family, sensor kinase
MIGLPAILRRPGIGRNLTLAFSMLLAIFGAASYFAFAALLELHEAMHRVERDADYMGRVHRLSGAIRDQYIQIAHAIVTGNERDADRYRAAAGAVAQMGKRVAAEARSSEEKRMVAEILAATANLDALFNRKVLPAARRGEVGSSAAALDQELLRVVTVARAAADRLSAASERAIADFGAHGRAIQHGAVRTMVIFLLVAIACAGGVAFYLYRSLASPIAGLAAGAARIASGDLDTQLPVVGRDELAKLAEQFNVMTGSLKEQQSKLVQSEKLAGIGRLAAGVAHEINNPLGVIIGYVKLLRRRGTPSIDGELAILEDEAERCRQVVEDLLDLTRTPPLELTTVNLRTLTEEIVERLRVSLSRPRVQVTIEGDGEVTGSARQLQQVFYNVLKNAVEAAGAEGAVSVRIALDEAGEVAVSISDSGPGIESKNRAYVFEPFFTTKPSGTGLGLAVARALVRTHGGDLQLADSSGKGATFRVTLPTEFRRSR